MGDTVLANEYFRRSAVVSKKYGYSRGYFAANLLLADYFIGVGAKDSALYYVTNAQQVVKTLNSPEISLRAYNTWSRYYHMVNNRDSIVKYQALIIAVTNNLFTIRNLQQFENINFEEHQKQLAVETAQKEIRDTWRMYFLLAGLFIILIIVVILWRNNRHRRMANDQLSMQKNSLESTLSDLRSAQSRLIHSEKMASLGELTAGIAHEIQNPLNFVNNFSELNSELVGELESAAERGNFADIKNIIKDIRENEGKINHHGKRADAIVKGMLQHSRGGSRVKEPTDINALCDEYIRLAYQGHRSKDKSFTATIKTNFDETLGKINVIPQDVSRVILNLISNAFYTVSQKQNQDIVGYTPVVSLSTAQLNNNVEIRVGDNGNGISQTVVDKIFQPFFTTKPTGQGTGLGLSISYEIVKAHGGELRVETKEGEGSEFVVSFPHS
jgi:signal transduction histidine kinase